MTGKALGAVPAALDPGLRILLEGVKENLEEGDGVRGDPMSRRITLGDLVSMGMVELKGTLIDRNLTPPLTPDIAAPVGDTVVTDTPPAPSGFEVSAGFSKIVLEWDVPKYSNHGLTQVWRAATDNLSDAILIGTSQTFMYSDAVEPGETWFYWIRFVSDSDVVGPYNDTVGTSATTAQDPAVLLEALSGEITATQLHQALTDKIALIDGPESLAGSVAARIASEAQLREEANQAVALVVDQLTTKVSENVAAIEQSMESIDGIRAQWSIRTDVNGHVAGIGLMNDGATSSFQILTSNFAVLDHNDPSRVIIGTFNGNAVIDGAYINNLVVRDQQVENLNVDKLVGDKASFVRSNIGTAVIGTAEIVDILKSSNYSSVAGWAIHKSGLAVFNQAVIRGTLQSSGYGVYTSGWLLESNGAFTLRGSGGKIILSTAGVPADSVSGLGLLATKNSVSAGEVDGLGNLATRNVIDNGTYIANAIVDTLHLQGQAVTHKVATYIPTAFYVHSRTDYQTLAQVQIEATGAPMTITASFLDQGKVTSNAYEVRVLKGGRELWLNALIPPAPPSMDLETGVTPPDGWHSNSIKIEDDSPSPGWQTYYLQARILHIDHVKVKARYLSAKETKR